MNSQCRNSEATVTRPASPVPTGKETRKSNPRLGANRHDYRISSRTVIFKNLKFTGRLVLTVLQILAVVDARQLQQEKDARIQYSGPDHEPNGARTICGCGRTFKSTATWSITNWSGKHHCQTCGILLCYECVDGKSGERTCRAVKGVREAHSASPSSAQRDKRKSQKELDTQFSAFSQSEAEDGLVSSEFSDDHHRRNCTGRWGFDYGLDNLQPGERMERFDHLDCDVAKWVPAGTYVKINTFGWVEVQEEDGRLWCHKAVVRRQGSDKKCDKKKAKHYAYNSTTSDHLFNEMAHFHMAGKSGAMWRAKGGGPLVATRFVNGEVQPHRKNYGKTRRAPAHNGRAQPQKNIHGLEAATTMPKLYISKKTEKNFTGPPKKADEFTGPAFYAGKEVNVRSWSTSKWNREIRIGHFTYENWEAERDAGRLNEKQRPWGQWDIDYAPLNQLTPRTKKSLAQFIGAAWYDGKQITIKKWVQGWAHFTYDNWQTDCKDQQSYDFGIMGMRAWRKDDLDQAKDGITRRERRRLSSRRN